jgi:uncharacterized protein YecE (DUF72 family)
MNRIEELAAAQRIVCHPLPSFEHTRKRKKKNMYQTLRVRHQSTYYKRKKRQINEYNSKYLEREMVGWVEKVKVAAPHKLYILFL